MGIIETANSLLTDTGALFSASGYQKLSNGLIIQWFSPEQGYSQTNTVHTFPIAFPNACLKASATTGAIAGSGVVVASINGLPTATTITIYGDYSSSTVSGDVHIIAIGY